MKALRVHKYKKDTFEHISLDEIGVPRAKASEVLVKVQASAFNPVDLHLATNDTSMMTGRKPPLPLGVDGAGIVETCGDDVKTFKKGDRVFFYTGLVHCGTFAQYIAVAAKACAVIPKEWSYQEAAAMALPLLCGYQAIAHMGLQKTSRVLVHGGSGGVGAATAMMATAKGAVVETTGAPSHENYLQKLGVAKHYDYRKTKISEIKPGFDAVLDAFGGKSFTGSLPLIKKGGKIVSLKVMTRLDDLKRNGMRINWLIKLLITLVFRSAIKKARKAGVEVIGMAAYPDGSALASATKIALKQGFKPRIHKTYPLAQAKDALAHMKKGAPGKIVLNPKYK